MDDTLYNLFARKKDLSCKGVPVEFRLETLTSKQLLYYKQHYKKLGFRVTWNFSTFGDGNYEE